jgi:hypothetical protein
MLSAGALPDHLFSSAAQQSSITSGAVAPFTASQSSTTPPSSAFTPQQLCQAYGINSITLGSLAGTGAGQTIAIVDAYDDPALLNSSAANFASSDLHKFDAQFGLADPPSFVKLNQSGGTTLPGVDPAGPGITSWEGEEALDVEWAHVVAPGASIDLVEATSDSFSDMMTAVNTARNLPGVSVVSMSFDWTEAQLDSLNGSGSELSSDATFATPAGHQGVTFVAATGDDGYPGGYPAYSPSVLAVGGTSLYTSGGSYSYEYPWSGSGDGASIYESEPGFQAAVQNSGSREIGDVAFVGDPNTGVALYDSYDFGSSTPWTTIGGTSLSTVCWAGLVATADQLRTSQGQGTLDGASQTLPGLYALPQTDFHSPAASWGYSEGTGVGTPVANKLVPDLASLADLGQATTLTVSAAGAATYAGTVNLTATLSAGSEGVANQTVTFFVAGEDVGTATTNASGVATLASASTAGLNAGSYSSGLMATFAGNTSDRSAIAYANLTVNKAPLTVTANSTIKPYGAPDPAFSAFYMSLVGGHGPGALGGAVSFTTNEPTTGYAAPGNYTITPAGLTSSNYAITFAPGTLTVTPAPTTVAVSASATSVGLGQPLTLTATVAALSPSIATPTGGMVTFYVDGIAQPNPATLAGGSATLVDSALSLGAHTITASYSGDGVDFAAGITGVGPSSIIGTVAGNGNYGYSGDLGPATAAMLYVPFAVATDASGDIFIADTANNRIREVNHATGLITTVAGNGTDTYSGDNGQATAAGVGFPTGLAIDANGNLFIGQSTFASTTVNGETTYTFQPVIREVNLHSGVITTVAGNGTPGYSGDGGPATAASLGYNLGIAVDSSGDLFIADVNNARVREVNLKGVINTVAGDGTWGYSGDSGPATAAELELGPGLAVDGPGHLFIADTGNDRVREVNLSSGVITTVAGGGSSPASSSAATPATGGTTISGGTITLGGVTGISGAYGGDGGPATAAFLDQPGGIALDASGDLFIADTDNERVREVVQATGEIITVAGNGTQAYGGDGGPATATTLDNPCGIAIDATGNLVIADVGNERIRDVSASAFVKVFQATTMNLSAPGAAMYGGTIAISATLSSGGTGVPNETITFSVDGTSSGTATTNASGVATLAAASLAGVSAGSYAAGLVASFAGDATYAPTTAAASLTVNEAPLTITANSASKPYGAPDPAFSVSYAGLVGGDGPGALGGTLAFSTNEPTTGYASPGSYTVAPAGLTSNNYTITFDPNTLTVTEAQTTVAVAASATSTLYGQSVTVTATVSVNSPSTAMLSGGTVTFFVDGVAQPNPPALANNSATLLDSSLSLGPHTITASYSGEGADFAASTSLAVGPSSIITTVAGGGAGGNGSPATTAALGFPNSVTVDAAGDLFIAEGSANLIQEVVKATGDLITVAGNGSWRFSGDGGPATAASLDNPVGIAADAEGNVFIADEWDQRIREVVKATGDIITVAGDGAQGYDGDGGPATAASLDNPWSVTVDAAGNLFIADFGNQRVREVVKATGNIITVAGGGNSGLGDGGPATAAYVSEPESVALDAAGNLFIADGNRIREVVKATGNIITVAGNGNWGFGGNGGPATAARLWGPYGITVDAAGNIFIADTNDDRVREVVQATGNIVTVAGDGFSSYGGDGGPATAASLSLPSGVAVDALGNLYIADNENSRIREVSAGGAMVDVLQTTTMSLSAPGAATYGGTIALTATLSAGGVGVPGETATFSVDGNSVGTATTNANGVATLAAASVAGVGVGSYSGYVTASFGGDASNTASTAAANLTVNKAPLTVTAIAASKPYGAPDPAFSASYTGFASGDNSSVLGGALVFSTNEPKTGFASPGNYTVAPAGLTSNNYTITFAAGTLTVVAAATAVTVSPSATSVAIGQSLTVTATVTVLSPSVAAPSGGTVTFYVDGVAQPKPPVLSGGSAKLVDSSLSAGAHTITASYSGGGADFAGSARTAVVDVGQATTMSLSASGAATYGGSIAISATLLSGGAGVPNEMVTFSVHGTSVGTATTGANGVAMLAAASVAGLNAGSYSGYLTASFAGDASYATASAVANLTVNKAPLTVSANNALKTYGSADPPFSASYSGFVNGDGSGNLSGKLSFSTNEPATGSAAVGTYNITPSGLTSGNYVITFDNGTLTVVAATLAGDWPTFGDGPSHTGYFAGDVGETPTTSLLWSSNLESSLNQVAVVGGVVYATNDSYFGASYLTALNSATGAQLWNYAFNTAFSVNPPTVDGGHVYVQRSDNEGDTQLWSFNAATGAVVWSAPFGSQWENYCAPTVANGSIYIDGGTYGGMYAFNQASGSQEFFDSEPMCDEWTPSYYNNHVYSWVQGTFAEYSPTTGATDWSVNLGGSYYTYSMNDSVAAISDGQAFLIGSNGLFAVNLSTQSESWQVSGNTFSGSPAVANGVVYAISGDTVEAFNAASGAPVGTYTAGESLLADPQPIVTDDSLIVASADKTYIFNLQQQTLAGSLPVGGLLSLANNVLYVASDSGILYAYEVVPAGSATTTTISASAYTTMFGQSVTFTANVTVNAPNSPTLNYGSVTFQDGNTTLGTASVVNGQAMFTVSTLPAGSDLVTASYLANVNYAASTAASGAWITVSAPPAFSLAGPSAGTFAAGTSVTVGWSAADVDVAGPSKISLGYDPDATAFDANQHWLEVDQVTAANGTGAYSWNTTGVAAGTYYLSGYMYDFADSQAVFSHLGASIVITASASAPTAFTLTGPSAGTFSAGQSVTIHWTAANVNVGGPTKITLGYDPDTTAFDANQHWLEVDQVTAANGAASYSWNTTGVASGTYYLSGYMYDFATGHAVYSHLGTSIVITGGSPPAFTLGGPIAGTFTAGQSVTIGWSASSVDAAGPTKITLGYDPDATAFDANQHWIEVDGVTAANGTASYSWNTTGVASGTYYLSGYMYDFSTGHAVYSHLTTSIVITGGAPPAFTLNGPSAGTFTAGQSVTIGWTAASVDVAGPTKITLGYDSDATPFDANQHWIEVDGVTAANSAASYVWNTTGVASGTYYLSGYMYDFSTGKAVYSSVATSIVITGGAPPAFTLTGPSAGTFTAGQSVTVGWTATNVDVGGPTKITLGYDPDATAFDANQHWLEIDQVTAANGAGSYTWNTTGVAAGTYYLSGYMYDFVVDKAVYSNLTTSIVIS